jgi:hypothetical protein
VRSLRDLGHRFVITIDDVDRLEPAEVIEILRLVRSVVDLPNVIYLLCYDSGTLAHSIETAVGVKSGHSYLEKIVQLTVMVPRPEPFQLRQWFSDELHLKASARASGSSTCCGYSVRDRLGNLADQHVVGSWGCADADAEQRIKRGMPCPAPIETEDELVEVVLEVGPPQSVVNAQAPALEI